MAQEIKQGEAIRETLANACKRSGTPLFTEEKTMSVSSESAILLDVADHVGWITLNRPAAYNAINTELAEQLLDAVIRCDEDDGIRAVVITGKGPSFCAGGDIRQMMDAVGADGHAGAFLKTLTVSLHETIATIAHTSKPVIMAVNGTAAGAGFSLALAGDLVLAAENARFTVAYTAIGLAPDGSSTFTLPRLIGAKRAFELMYTNRAMSANEAKELGLVNQVFPAAQFIQHVREYTARVAEGPTVALGYAKKLLTLSAHDSLETQMEHERRAIAACGRTADFREGASAFFAKRPARFQGR
jgi:2-(1,2-epoxy-1,2-dihydrophenyl)acetyl-CoA isomerase